MLYLVFTRGYTSPSGRDEPAELRREAIRLAKLLAALMPDEPEALGLVALLLLQDSRSAARYTAGGDVVLLEDQDRTRWDRAEIAEALGVLGRALRRGTVGQYQLQAAIAAQHAQARTAADTDWARIAALYAQLRTLAPSPVVALNHAVAVAMADGPETGLALVEAIDGLDRYHLWHAARADLLRRLGRAGDAVAAYRRARDLAEAPGRPPLPHRPPARTGVLMRLSVLDHGPPAPRPAVPDAHEQGVPRRQPGHRQDAAVPAGVPDPAAAGPDRARDARRVLLDGGRARVPRDEHGPGARVPVLHRHPRRADADRRPR